MAIVRLVTLGLSLIVAAGIGTDCAYALAETIDSGNLARVNPQISDNEMVQIAKVVIKTTKGPSSRHQVQQCPPGERPGWGTRPGKLVCRPVRR